MISHDSEITLLLYTHYTVDHIMISAAMEEPVSGRIIVKYDRGRVDEMHKIKGAFLHSYREANSRTNQRQGHKD